MKRKADPAAGSSRPPKQSQTLPARPNKRQKAEDGTITDNSNTKSRLAASATDKSFRPTKSVVQTEEKAFPRGGASVLTPLEHKQIQNEATRDVLFEQTNGKRKPGSESSDEEAGLENGEKTTKQKPKKKKKRKETVLDGDAHEARTKVEGLSYKRLVPGMLILGQISEITARDVVVTLPNNLSGYVALTEISDTLNQRVETLLGEEENADDSSSEPDFKDIDLKKLFVVGQYIRAYVLSCGTEGSSSGKRRIDLSLNPKLANTGISRAEILPDTMLQASVSSVEDHGLIMDFGLESNDLKGFLSAKQLGERNIADIEEGTVFLCLVVKTSSNGRTVTLSLDTTGIRNVKKHFMSSTVSVRAYLPGTAVELLVSDVIDSGISGKIVGSLHATADLIHLGLDLKKDLEKRFALGAKIKSRILFKFPEDVSHPLGLSILPGILSMEAKETIPQTGSDGVDQFVVSTILEAAKVIKVLPTMGLFLNIGASAIGFAHISRISDKKIDKLSADSGSYKVGSNHKARIIGFNSIDNLYLVSLEPKVLSQPFLQVKDVKIGQIVQGTVEKLILNERGLGGILVNLADGISGLVAPAHLADVHLQHPERKFKEGLSVKARVLSTDLEKRRIALTLKKTLVNSEVEPWLSYENIEIGAQSPGTLINILPTGAVVQFYGSVRGFLPKAEMSEAYISDPTEHFKVGQVVNVRVLDIDAAEQKMRVSCKDPSSFGPKELKAFTKLEIGGITKGTITEITTTMISLDLEKSLKGMLNISQLSDGSETKNKNTAKKLRVGQVISDLVILEKRDKRHVVVLSHKPEFIKAARAGTLITRIDQLQLGAKVVGYVRNITKTIVFVEFADAAVAIIPISNLEDEKKTLPDFGLSAGQTISAYVSSLDLNNNKAVLTTNPAQLSSANKSNKQSSKMAATEPVNEAMSDLSLGQITEARITAVKPLQLNVELAGGVPGRVDATEVFSSFSEVKDWKHPLVSYKVGQNIKARVIGLHDTKSRTYLPISHRRSNTVLELSMREKDANEAMVLQTEKVVIKQRYIGIISKHAEGYILVKLSPAVYGRVLHINLTNDVSKLQSVEANFPAGAAIQVKVAKLDIEANKIELAAIEVDTKAETVSDLTIGSIMVGRVIRTTDSGVLVSLGQSTAGLISLTELADDFSSANPGNFSKNEVVQVKVIGLDKPNKKVLLSARPSRLTSQTSKVSVIDKSLDSIADLTVNDVIRGFINKVADKGVFVALAPNVTAFVKISDLSDSFLKEWKSLFTVGQVVKGKILKIDQGRNDILMTLKPSMLEKDYIPPVTFEDMKVGQIYTAKVKKVENFGVFIIVDGSKNVSGLCHVSEIADDKIKDVTKLYDVGDVVKAKVIKIDKEKHRVNFGLKTSYFKDATDAEDDNDVSGADEDESDEAEDAESDLGDVEMIDQGSIEDSDGDDETAEVTVKASKGLSVGGFDWSGAIEQDIQTVANDDEEDISTDRKRKKKKPTITVDKTGELDKYGPQAVADFERLLLGKPNSSSVWIQYMAFQLGLGEVDKARTIAERALKTIDIREEDEKLNLWIALLNLENTYGNDESIDEVFKRACGLNDKEEMHERLVSIFIESGKHDVRLSSSKP